MNKNILLVDVKEIQFFRKSSVNYQFVIEEKQEEK